MCFTKSGTAVDLTKHRLSLINLSVKKNVVYAIFAQEV